MLDKVLSECKPQDERIINLNSVRKSHGMPWAKILATAAAIAIIVGCISFGGSPLAEPACAEGYCAILENGKGEAVLMRVGADGLVNSAKEISSPPEKPVIKPIPFSQAAQKAENGAVRYERHGEELGSAWEGFGEGIAQDVENIGDAFDKGDIDAIAGLDAQALVGKRIEEAMVIVARALNGTSDSGAAEAFLISLISAPQGDSPSGEALVNKLMNAVSNATAANSGAVIAQSLSNTQELESAAGRNGVSLGKAGFMAGIIKAADESGLEEFDRLANFDLNTLAVLAGGLLDKLPDTKVSGTPDSSAFVGVESAIKKLVSSIKLSGSDSVAKAQANIKPRGESVLYDVTVEINGATIVGGQVDAVSGELLEMFSDDGSGRKTVYVKSSDFSIDSTEVSVVYDPSTGLAVNVTDDNVFDSTDVQVTINKDGTILVAVSDTGENVNVTVPAYDKEKGFVDWLTKLIKGNVAANIGS